MQEIYDSFYAILHSFHFGGGQGFLHGMCAQLLRILFNGDVFIFSQVILNE